MPSLKGALWLALLGSVTAQTDVSFSFSNVFSTLPPNSTYSLVNPSYTFSLPTGQVTVTASQSLTGQTNGTFASTRASNATGSSQSTVSSQSQSVTLISGGTPTSVRGGNSTASSTSSAARPSNTVACNGWTEFCTRKYSNISSICSHNAAFVVKNDAASNQMLPIWTQLNDGIRMLEGETHYVNDTIYNCHTSCDLLNVGTFQSELELVRRWLAENPYEVLTILISNSDFVSVEKYVPSIENSGILEYVYTPEYIPQYRDQWPTLGEMILRNQRLVFFMDYNANQTAVPYILDQYTHIWQTPFSPTNRSFPCTIADPVGLSPSVAEEKWMYLANHNLNQAVDISAIFGINAKTILIPNTALLNVTNSQGDQYGELGATLDNCTAKWGRPPNFFVVDYYNIGSPEPCSVFHVAAKANGVNYTLDKCPYSGTPSSAVMPSPGRLSLLVALLAALVFV